MDQAWVLDVGETRILVVLGIGGVNDGPVGRAVAQVLLRQGPEVVPQLDRVGQLLLGRRSSGSYTDDRG